MTARNLEKLPHFLGIGAPRAGTSWLHRNLAAHPAIWMPPRKELHYFDRSTRYPTTSHLASNSILTRLFSRAPHDRKFRRQAWSALVKSAANREWKTFAWSFDYYLKPCSDQWYAALFKQADVPRWGEITPGYSLMDESDVHRVADLMPEVKIIYILRDPVERAWSAVRYVHARAGVDTRSLPVEQIWQHCQRRGVLEGGEYRTSLDRWRNHFLDDQMLVCFFDELSMDPSGFLARILNFLEVEPDPGTGRGTAVNSAPSQHMPSEIRTRLSMYYVDQLERLSTEFGDPVDRWLDRARAEA